MSNSKLLYIITSAPYSNANGQEALDAILMGSAFEQEISVLFIHDGVFQLKSNQSTDGTELKQFTKTYQALGDFGVNRIFVHDLSMKARGLTSDLLAFRATELDNERVRTLISEQYRVFTF